MQQLRPTPDTDERAFRQEVSQVFRRWYEASANAEHFSANARRLGRYAGQSLALVRKHRLRMSLNTLLFWRAMDALDSSAQRFPGTFDLMETMREFFEPDAEELMQQVVGGALDRERNAALAGLLRDGTGQAHRALGELAERQGEWTVEAEESGTEYRANNRRASLLSVGLVGMSLLVLGLGAPLDAAIRAGMLGLASVLAIWTVAEVTAR
jgi:hypothetical protein